MKTINLEQILNLGKNLSIFEHNKNHYCFTFNDRVETLQVSIRFIENIISTGFFRKTTQNKSYFVIAITKGESFKYYFGDEEYFKLVEFMDKLRYRQNMEKDRLTKKLVNNYN